MTLPRTVLRTIRRHALLESGDRLAIAVSGGPDSVALVWIIRELQEGGDLPGRLVGLIHVNHGLRGDESERDERFCRLLAGRLELPIEVGRFEIGPLARARRRSTEATARDVRYAFLAEAAARLGATAVATGHTMDDQAETVLLRLLRGAGSRGLSGIRIRRGPFVRPLLTSRRHELRRYLDRRNEPFCEDSSNLDLSVARNRVRHTLLPAIEAVAPAAVEALARFASTAAADESYLERRAIDAARSVVLLNKDGVQVDAQALSRLPGAVSRRVVRRAVESVTAGRTVSARHLQAILDLAASPAPAGHLDLSGVTAERRGGAITLAAAAKGRESARRISFDEALPVPGKADVASVGISVTAVRCDRVAGELDAGEDVAVLQEAGLVGPLRVRNRRPGDRFRPLGAPGRRKLQDVLVDRKIRRGDRDRVPVVVDAAGRIVWVAGIAIAEEYRVTTPNAGVVVLKLERSNSGAGGDGPRE